MTKETGFFFFFFGRKEFLFLLIFSCLVRTLSFSCFFSSPFLIPLFFSFFFLGKTKPKPKKKKKKKLTNASILVDWQWGASNRVSSDASAATPPNDACAPESTYRVADSTRARAGAVSHEAHQRDQIFCLVSSSHSNDSNPPVPKHTIKKWDKNVGQKLSLKKCHSKFQRKVDFLDCCRKNSHHKVSIKKFDWCWGLGFFFFFWFVVFSEPFWLYWCFSPEKLSPIICQSKFSTFWLKQ